jgi:cell filamentation protein
MNDFCRDLNARIKHLPRLDSNNYIDEIINLLTWAHHRFLWIHPFDDYNGRIARLLNNVILLNQNLPPMELKIETSKARQKYVRALKHADQGDYRGLKQLIEQSFIEAIEQIK